MNLDEQLEEWSYELERFIAGNTVQLIVAIFFCFALFVWAAKWLLDRRSENLRYMYSQWKAIKKRGEFLTDRLTLYLSDLDGKFTQLRGKCYRLSSHRYKEEYLGKITTHTDLQTGERTVEMAETKVTVWKKTEVYAFLNKKEQTVAAVRMSDLKPHQSLLSETGYMQLSRIDPRRNNMLFYIIMIVEMVLIALLFWAIAEDRELDFLLDNSMWGWYALIIVALATQFWIMKALFGHFAVAIDQDTNREEIALTTPKGKAFSMLLPVSSIRIYWYRGCPVADTLALDTAKIIKEIDKENKAIITTYSADLANAKADIALLTTLVDEKALQLSQAFQRALEERAVGYLEGRIDSHAELNRPDVGLGGAIRWVETLRPFLIALAIVGGGIFAIKIIGGMINLTEDQTTLGMIALILIAIGFLLVGARAIFEATRARQF